jgi:hypothetical protein
LRVLLHSQQPVFHRSGASCSRFCFCSKPCFFFRDTLCLGLGLCG